MLVLATLIVAAAAATGPLTPRERVAFQGAKCESYRTTLQDAVAKAAASEPSDTTPTSIMQRLVGTLQRPASEDEATWKLCSSYAIRDLDDFRARSIAIEATTTLKRLAATMKGNFIELATLCGSTTPVPADVTVLKDGPYTAQTSEWDETWRCVGGNLFDGKSQNFQYAITTKGSSFTITAKGYPHRDGKLHTLSISGKVSGGELKVGEIAKK